MMGAPKVCLNVLPIDPSAMKVYGRIGFVGLETGVPGDGTEEWIELGFEK